MQEVDVITEKEQATNLIDVYTDLLRIKQAADKEKEVNNKSKAGGAGGCGRGFGYRMTAQGPGSVPRPLSFAF